MSQMTKEEATLWARGADSVGGELMLRNKVVATYINGVFALTDAGLAELEVEEIEAVEVEEIEAVEVEEIEAVEVKPASKKASNKKPAVQGESVPHTQEGLDELPLD